MPIQQQMFQLLKMIHLQETPMAADRLFQEQIRADQHNMVSHLSYVQHESQELHAMVTAQGERLTN